MQRRHQNPPQTPPPPPAASSCVLCGCEPGEPPADPLAPGAGTCHGDCRGRTRVPRPGSVAALHAEIITLFTLDPDGPDTPAHLLYARVLQDHGVDHAAVTAQLQRPSGR